MGRHGFWGIFLLAAWPNALFDLCGICCGHFLMPFWQFFGATLMGKALVKVRRAHLPAVQSTPHCPCHPPAVLHAIPKMHRQAQSC